MLPREDPLDAAEAKEREELSPSRPVIPTMVAKGQDAPPRETKSPQGDTLYSLFSKPDIPIHHDLTAFAELTRHYVRWAWLAEGSWGELDKVAQIEQNCKSLLERLTKFQDANLKKSIDVISNTLEPLQKKLDKLQKSGPEKTYVFCDQHFPYSKNPGTNAAALEKLRSISPSASLDHLSDFVVCTVDSDKYQSAFVQGIRSGYFVSEAYISEKLNSDEEELRKFVHAQIASFHADPRNVGKIISFEGDYTQKFLVQAVNYCNQRGYRWQIDPNLQKKILEHNKDAESLKSLFAHTPDDEAEDNWKNWLKKNNYPDSKLDRKPGKDPDPVEKLEDSLPRLTEAKADAGKTTAVQKASVCPITPKTWIKAALPAELHTSKRDRTIVTDPNKNPSVTIGTGEEKKTPAEVQLEIHDEDEKEDEKEKEPFAVLQSNTPPPPAGPQ